MSFPSPNPTFDNPPFAQAALRALILRLSPLQDVDRSATHLFLASAVRRAVPDAYVDFCFFPTRTERARFHASGRPHLLGMQSDRPADAFDLVLVTNSFALELLNLPWLLNQSNIPVWADERDGRWPPFLLGGSNAFAAAALVRPDHTAVPDVIFFGEGETHVERFLRAWLAARDDSKRARLQTAANAADGFWVTGSRPARAVRQAVARPVAPDAPALYPLLDSGAAETVRIRISYGCPAFCAFCFEGFERKPYRELRLEQVLAEARALKALSGAREAEMDAFNVNTHRDFAAIVAGLARLFDRVALKSQRVDILAAQPLLADLELACGKRSFTLGIEGISQRMRSFLDKSLTTEEVRLVLRGLLEKKVRELKLFFLLTGHESEGDLAEFDDLCHRLPRWLSPTGTRIVFSFGLLVRMPNTPLRHDRLFLDRTAAEGLIGRVRDACESRGFEFRLSSTWPEYAASQVLVAGGHELCETVVEFARTGVCYDGHLPGRCTDRLLRALRGSLADEKGADHVFPFDFVTRSVTDAFLYRQYERARLYRDTGYCMGEKCRRCGACVDADERSAIVRRPRVPPVAATDVSIVAGLTREKARLPVLYVRARLPPFFGRTTPQWTGVCLLRLLLKARPDLIEDVLTVDDAVFGTGEAGDRFPILAGETVLAVKGWDPDALRVEFAGRIETDGGVEFGSPVRDFIPGRFQRAEIEFHQPAGSVETWVRSIREQGCVFTLRRDGTDRFLDIPRGKRSAGIVAARIREDDAGLKVCVTATPRLACRALLDRVEQDGGPVRAVCRRLTLTSAGIGQVLEPASGFEPETC